MSNPAKTRAIAEARVKTDKVDAEILAQLLAADYLPSVWLPDPQANALRLQVLRRAHIVRQRTRLKNQVHAILARNVVPRCPAADLFGIKGRAWLEGQDLPADERAAATALLRQLYPHARELALIDADLARVALAHKDVRQLMTSVGRPYRISRVMPVASRYLLTPHALVQTVPCNPQAGEKIAPRANDRPCPAGQRS